MLGHGWCEWRVAWRHKVNVGEVEWIGNKKVMRFTVNLENKCDIPT